MDPNARFEVALIATEKYQQFLEFITLAREEIAMTVRRFAGERLGKSMPLVN